MLIDCLYAWRKMARGQIALDPTRRHYAEERNIGGKRHSSSFTKKVDGDICRHAFRDGYKIHTLDY